MTTKNLSLTKITLLSAKIPVLYLLIGTVLLAMSYMEDILPLSAWKYSIPVTEKIGNIFIALAATSFIYNLIAISCKRLEKRYAENQHVVSLILSSTRKGLRILFSLIAINLFISILGPTKFYLVIAKDFINIIIIGGVGWLVVQIIYTLEAILYKYMTTHTSDDHNKIKALYTKLHIMKNIATVIVGIITLAAILMSFSSVRHIGISLLASAGFLTAIVGLSAQKTLFSMFSGLQIALTQPVKIGDIVLVEKESGIVEQINFTYVTLKLGDRRRLMVPINYFIDKPFENWSHEGNSLRSSLHFHVDFMMPIDPLRNELDNILKNSPFWDGVAKKLQVSNLTDNCVELRVQISASNADNLSDLRAEVREKMLVFMRANYAEFFPKIRQN